MANIALAMEALNLNGRWQLVEKAGARLPEHPMNLQPLAKLFLEGMG